MPRVKNEIKKVEMKLYLSPDAKEKLVLLATKSKINQSELIERFIRDFDDGLQVAENVNYIKEREQIFSELAGYIADINESQENSHESNKKIIEKIKQIESKVEFQSSQQERLIRLGEKLINYLDEKPKTVLDALQKIFNKS